MNFLNNLADWSFLVLDQGGYWIIFLFSVVEAIPFIGTLVPGHTLIVAAGFLSSLDLLSLPRVIILASCGAILGDFISYYVGERWGHSLLSRYGRYLFIKEEQIDKTKKLLLNHPGKALILGRFVSVTRALAPFLAGISRVPLLKFLWFNIIGGISWAVSSVLVGYLFGASYEIGSKYLGRAFFAAAIMAILISYGYSFFNRKKHIFQKYHLHVLLFNLGSLYLFAKMAEDVLDGESVVRLDAIVNQGLPSIQTPTLTALMLVITQIGGPVILAALALILLIFLLRRQRWYQAVLLAISLGGAGVIESVTKLLVHRLRPLHQLVIETDYSFPSGHATMAAVFFLNLIFIFRGNIKSRLLRYLYYLANTLAFMAIGFSRVYLSVHWLSDVIAGFALAIFWFTLLILLFHLLAGLYGDRLKKFGWWNKFVQTENK